MSTDRVWATTDPESLRPTANAIFQRFFTTERDRGGTGLGLAIVQVVAETRDGSIRFDSGDDGTSFRLVL